MSTEPREAMAGKTDEDGGLAVVALVALEFAAVLLSGVAIYLAMTGGL